MELFTRPLAARLEAAASTLSETADGTQRLSGSVAAAAAGVTDFDLIGISYYSKWSKYSLAGLGGGSHKDILIGTDPSTGAIRSIGLNAAGGWTQLKLNFSPVVEFNAAYGSFAISS